MKTVIKSAFLLAVLTMFITGCQKNGYELNLASESAITFTTGTYEAIWDPSGGAEAECALAGGCNGGAYKIDRGLEQGTFINEGGITVTGLSRTSFNWTSVNPVCKIIVKAGQGAYVFDIGGAKEGTITYPVIDGIKEKDISHITFCFGSPMVIAAKAFLVYNWVCTSGGPADIEFVGYYNFEPDYDGNKLYYYARDYMPIGNIVVSNVDADALWEVTLDTRDEAGYFYTNVYLFVGTLEEYNTLRATYGEDFYNYFPYKTGVFDPVPSVTVHLNF